MTDRHIKWLFLIVALPLAALYTASTPIGNYAIMGKENYTNDHHNQIEKVVKIVGQGKTIDVELTPRNRLFTNNGGAGLFGCR